MGILGGILGDLIKPVTDIVGKAVVDKDKVREIELEMRKIVDQADQRYHDEVMGQLEINKEEAKHASVFVAGWRPAVGWVGAAGLATSAILMPLASWVAVVGFGYEGGFPVIDTELLWVALSGILGLGGMRSFERFKGVGRDTLKGPALIPVDTKTGRAEVAEPPAPKAKAK